MLQPETPEIGEKTLPSCCSKTNYETDFGLQEFD